MRHGPYLFYGFEAHSDLQLLELRYSDSKRQLPQLQIEQIATPVVPAEPGHRFRLTETGALRIFVDRWNYFDLSPERGWIGGAWQSATPEGLLRSALYGPVAAALFSRLGILALHASVVSIGGRGWVFCGASGVGKSTMAAVLAARGNDRIADDMAVLRSVSEGSFEVAAGPQRAKLRSNLMDGLPYEVPADSVWDAQEEKYLVPVSIPDTVIPLAGICLLDSKPHPRVEVERVTGAEAALALMAQIFRPAIAAGIGATPRLLEQSATVASAVPVFHLRRRLDVRDLTEAADLVEGLALNA